MKRLVAGRRTGAIGLGCMGMTWAYTRPEENAAATFVALEQLDAVPETVGERC